MVTVIAAVAVVSYFAGQIEFDGDADGSGTFIIGAEILIDPETHKLQIKTGSTAPATISNLKKQS